MSDENSLEDLKKLEDNDIKLKKKKNKNIKINKDDIFYRVRMEYNKLSHIFKASTNEVARGTYVIIETSYGNEIGVVEGRVKSHDDILSQDEISNVLREATEEDMKKFHQNIDRAEEAFNITKDKIKAHKLEMKLTSVYCFLEDSKILFNFTADGRVDFRELVKDLAGVFRTRIELRQIGVRDECRILCGFGQCGRDLCCSKVINDLQPISIKMAKEQNITLNSMKISGVCGRLLCCLAYEYDTYVKEKKAYPNEGALIKVNNENYIVDEVNIQSKTLKISNEEHRERYMFVKSDLIFYNKVKKAYILKDIERSH